MKNMLLLDVVTQRRVDSSLKEPGRQSCVTTCQGCSLFPPARAVHNQSSLGIMNLDSIASSTTLHQIFKVYGKIKLLLTSRLSNASFITITIHWCLHCITVVRYHIQCVSSEDKIWLRIKYRCRFLLLSCYHGS